MQTVGRPISALGSALLGLALAALAAGVAQARDDMAEVTIQAQSVRGGIHMLTGRGGNIGASVGQDGIFLVDDQYAPLHERIVAALAAIHPGPVRFVLNTHWHGDHTGGNEALGTLGAVIVAHEAVRTRMSSEQFIAAIGRRVPPSPPGALPVVTFTRDVSLHLNGQTIRAFHVESAHTDGDVVVHWLEADVIHTGDVFFAGTYPFVDVSSGGSIDGTIAAVDRILALAGEGTRIIPGHGPLASRSDLQSYRNMLALARERVAAAMAAGRDLSAIVAHAPLADLDERWGSGFVKADAFVKTIHASLARGS
jgi:glyoxylase-like metal-dependent hydrolase (beta-lactamase superfamily II)